MSAEVLHAELVNHQVTNLAELSYYIGCSDKHLTLSIDRRKPKDSDWLTFYVVNFTKMQGLPELSWATQGFDDVEDSYFKIETSAQFRGLTEKEACQKAAFAFDRIFRK